MWMSSNTWGRGTSFFFIYRRFHDDKVNYLHAIGKAISPPHKCFIVYRVTRSVSVFLDTLKKTVMFFFSTKWLRLRESNANPNLLFYMVPQLAVLTLNNDIWTEQPNLKSRSEFGGLKKSVHLFQGPIHVVIWRLNFIVLNYRKNIFQILAFNNYNDNKYNT